MQSEPDGEYKFILNYQDHLTKFVVLRPLKTKTADEVSDVLLDIFCLFGAPYILHSDNGREFCNRVIENLARKWSAIKLVHGKPRHSQSQGSVERANQDVRDSLVAWMADNNTSGWANGLKIIQNTKNNSYHSGIKRTPYEAMFGAPQRNGLIDSPLTSEVVKIITTEEELEYELSKLESSLIEVENEKETPMDETTPEVWPTIVNNNKHKEQESTSIEIISQCDNDCDKGSNCFECGQHIHNEDVDRS
ncbi:KRAB-A domain-containing protein 2-like [Macrosteles quadrilineatus]|uniref:KRAB-A domain-containing protein 2-like n=1 Tax=Macrosteles quadrilineatus TaxID=74068 RepID=UPI0023E0B804|nr:KRAB-A domain-containing protein 2-like [Macrosteles quadrilineatus]